MEVAATELAEAAPGPVAESAEARWSQCRRVSRAKGIDVLT